MSFQNVWVSSVENKSCFFSEVSLLLFSITKKKMLNSKMDKKGTYNVLFQVCFGIKTAALKLNWHESTFNYVKLRHFASDLTSI